MPIPRRSFLHLAATGSSLLAATSFPRLGWSSQAAAPPAAQLPPDVHVVPAGQDRFGAPRTLGFSSLAFKVDPAATSNNLFIIEHRNLMPGKGPALHIHLSQEEW